MSSDAAPARPRSLAEDLRARSDDALRALLAARPDLINPVPSDVAALAARAGTRPSVQRALEHLDRWHLQVLDALCLRTDPVRLADMRWEFDAEFAGVVDALRAQALLYGEDSALTVVRSVRDIVGVPAGLGPTAGQALASYPPARLERLLADLDLPPAGDPVQAAQAIGALFAAADPATGLTTLLAEAPPEAIEAARVLAGDRPTGQLERARREVTVASAATPVEWLLARGLLVGTAENTVVLPREVALHLRGGRVHPEAAPLPPALDVTERDPSAVDRAAAGAAFTAVRLVEDLLELWATQPPRVLRAGGLGVRERTRAAATLEVDDATLALLVEVALASGLLGSTDDIDEAWAPTAAYDAWLTEPTAGRWLGLVGFWLESTRVPGLAGSTDPKGRTLAPLGPDLDRGQAPEVRRATFEALAGAGPGRAATAASVVAQLAWHAPRRGGRLRDDLVAWTLAEAETLGITGRGALSGAGRALVGGDPERVKRLLEPLLPQPIDHVLLQADLTAVAPGPLTSDLAQRLRLAADVESTGGATVYRFSDASIRRALDGGWSAADLLALLEKHSRTPVPQPLTYLVEDVARRHGRVRVGAASAYVRCDDEAMVGEIVADRRAAVLRLRRLAPTVLAAQSPAESVLARLREMGYAPAAEGAAGEVVLRRVDARRAPTPRRAPRRLTEPGTPRATLLAAAVRAVRAGDRALTAVRRAPDPDGNGGSRTLPHSPIVDVLATLQQASEVGESVWIGYVSAEGHATQRVVEPLSVEGGYVSAYDHLRDEVRTFSLHRITGVATLDESA